MNYYFIQYILGRRRGWAIAWGKNLKHARRGLSLSYRGEAEFPGGWMKAFKKPGKAEPYCYPRFHQYP